MPMDVLCVGEMVIDFLPGAEAGSYLRNPGGAPANVAVAVARNGLASGFIGKVGQDAFGQFLLATLHENRVRIACDPVTDRAVTTMAFVTLGADGERSFTFARKPGADMLLDGADLDPAVLAEARIVHAGSCSLSQSPAAEATEDAMRMARQQDRLVSFDVNYRALLWENRQDQALERILKVLKYVNLLKVSEEELGLLGGRQRLVELIHEHRIALTVITLGQAGAECHVDGKWLHAPGRVADVVDTTGAGDAFWGAFLSCLVHHGVNRIADLTPARAERALVWGNVAGSLCVQAKGAMASLPTRVEIEAQLRKEGLQ
jgi:sugar/nucleoside kinase (ribokinase family)